MPFRRACAIPPQLLKRSTVRSQGANTHWTRKMCKFCATVHQCSLPFCCTWLGPRASNRVRICAQLVRQIQGIQTTEKAVAVVRAYRLFFCWLPNWCLGCQPGTAWLKPWMGLGGTSVDTSPSASTLLLPTRPPCTCSYSRLRCVARQKWCHCSSTVDTVEKPARTGLTQRVVAGFDQHAALAERLSG